MMPCKRDPTTLRYVVAYLKANLTRPQMCSLRRVGRALCTEGCFVIVRVSQRRARRAFSSPQAVFSCLYLICVRSSDVFNHTSWNVSVVDSALITLFMFLFQSTNLFLVCLLLSLFMPYVSCWCFAICLHFYCAVTSSRLTMIAMPQQADAMMIVFGSFL